MIERLASDIHATQHSGEFLDPFFLAQNMHARARRLAIANLADAEMLIREAGNLGQVGYTQNLAIRAKFLQAPAHHFGDTAANAAVDFIEHHGWNRAAVTGDHLDRQGHAREFAARGDFRQRLRRLARVRADQELNIVEPPGLCRLQRNGRQGGPEDAARHAESMHGLGHGFGKPGGACGARL